MVEAINGNLHALIRRGRGYRDHWNLAAGKPASPAAACVQQEKATRTAMACYKCDW